MVELITMPRLSDTMEEGTVVKWYKKLGDKVSEGDLLAEIETDKAVQEFESEYNGYLLYIGIPEGQSATVDSVLAVIGPKVTDVKPVYHKEKTNKKRIFSSPLARKIAREKSISLSKIKGSGENGRIIKRDLDSYLEKPQKVTTPVREVMLSPMRKVIAKRLVESKFTAPHYYLMIEVDMKNTVQYRKVINENFKYIKISFNDFIIKASAMALREHPKINSTWKEDKIIYHDNINIGIAVASEESLFVPVILQADKKMLRQISVEAKDKYSRARERKIQSKEMEGSTFTISNLGMFGIEIFTSIINQPNSCILSVGTILEKPVIKNGQIVTGNIMKLSLACDHRTIDGATGSAYLRTLKQFLENPIMMIV
ncbi:MAG: dihydrolipoamide acetyltransferase family protein [Candidatus Walczuchella monophlebidarum]